MPYRISYQGREWVQLHMPRTGGTSLRDAAHVEASKGAMHATQEAIPQAWEHLPTISTLRIDAIAWKNSFRRLIRKTQGPKVAQSFDKASPGDDIDPSFGIWEPCKVDVQDLQGFCTWYEAYIYLFVAQADRVIRTSDLPTHNENRFP